MYIDGLGMENLRSFESTSMRFNHPDRPKGPGLANVSLIVGVNGAGKTTILRSVALAVLGETLSNTGFVPRAFVRRPPGSTESEANAVLTAELIAHASDIPGSGSIVDVGGQPQPVGSIRAVVQIHRVGSREVVETSDRSDSISDDVMAELGAAFADQLPDWMLDRASFTMRDATEMLYDDRSPSYFMVGYPTNRRVDDGSANPTLRSRTRLPRYDRVSGLFEEETGLLPLVSWLPEVGATNPARFDQVVALISQLLPEGTTFFGEEEDDDMVFTHRGSVVPFGAMSDGYKSYIGWIGDLLYHLHTVAGPEQPLDEVPGVVLIDEIDAHLHASWQRQILPQISETFSRLQFIATTHSPMVVGTVRARNLIHVRPTDDANSTFAEPVTTELYGRNANQILLSELFGLDSTRSDEFVEQFEIVAQKAATGDLAAAEELSELSSYGFAGAAKGTSTRESLEAIEPSDQAEAALGDLLA